MTATKGEECTDIRIPGAYRMELEVSRDGEAMLRCPCCEGAGEHQDRPGNDPMAMNYNCRTCDGMGNIAPNLRTISAGWKGTSLGSRLNIKPSRFQEKTWHIHGMCESESAAGSAGKVVELAHLILSRLESVGSMGKLERLKAHRTLMIAANLQETEEAHQREHPVRTEAS